MLQDTFRLASFASSVCGRVLTKKLTRESQAVRTCGTAARQRITLKESTHLQIAHRAFEIYVSRGGHHGHDVGDWFEAERLLRTELQPKKRAVKQTRMKA